MNSPKAPLMHQRCEEVTNVFEPPPPEVPVWQVYVRSSKKHSSAYDSMCQAANICQLKTHRSNKWNQVAKGASTPQDRTGELESND